MKLRKDEEFCRRRMFEIPPLWQHKKGRFPKTVTIPEADEQSLTGACCHHSLSERRDDIITVSQ